MNTELEKLADKENICNTCGKPCDDNIYETADAEYECIDCHTACPPEDD